MSSPWTGDDIQGELTTSNLRLMEEEAQKSLLFKAIRGRYPLPLPTFKNLHYGLFHLLMIACELHAIRTILQANRTLLNSKMFGYEGTDVFEIIKNVKCFDIIYVFSSLFGVDASAILLCLVENQAMLYLHRTGKRWLFLSPSRCNRVWPQKFGNSPCKSWCRNRINRL